MLQRVSDFGIAHRDLFPASSPAGEAFATITRAVADVEVHRQHKRVTAPGGREAMIVMREVIIARMRVVARTARALTLGAGPRLTLRMPKRSSHDVVLSNARTFLSQAEANQVELERLGLPPNCLAELGTAADRLEAALHERMAGRSGVAAAQAGIATAIGAGCEAARNLDIFVPNAIEHDPVLFAAWRRDRRVVEGKRAPASTPELPLVESDPLRQAL